MQKNSLTNILTLLLYSGLVLLSACGGNSGSTNSEVKTYNANYGRSNYYPTEGPVEFTDTLWKIGPGMMLDATCYIVGNHFIMSDISRLRIFNLKNGELENSHFAKFKGQETKRFSNLCIDGNLIYFGYGVQLQTYDLGTGNVSTIFEYEEEEPKRYKGRIEISRIHRVSNGVVYFDVVGKLCALDISNESAKLLWQNTQYASRYASSYNSLASSDSLLYLPKTPGIQAIDAKSGKEVWSFTPENVNCESDSDPIISNNILIYMSGCVLYALHSKTGKELWHLDKWQNNHSIYSDISASPEMVYCALSPQKEVKYAQTIDYLYALDIKTGKEIWSKELEGDVDKRLSYSFPTVTRNVVYLETRSKFDDNESLDFENYPNTYLHIYDAKTGEEKNTITYPEPILFGPIFANGVIYFGTENSTQAIKK